MNEAIIDNALVEQKNLLYTYVYSCESSDWQRCLHILSINCQLWGLLGYAYKGAEICKAIRNRIADKRSRLAPQAYKQHSELSSLTMYANCLEIKFNEKQAKYMEIS